MTNKKRTGLLDYVVDLLQRHEQGRVSSIIKQALDNWIPDITDVESYPMDEQKATDAQKKVGKYVTDHIRRDIKKRTISPMWINKYQRYAAVAVIFILVSMGVLYYTQHDFMHERLGLVAEAKTFFQTTDAQTRLVILPDGSRIQMNRGTKFSYATHTFNHKLREVWLAGEAFFEVAKNPEKPFIIHTGDMSTTVCGTSFNIKAYPQLGENVVSVRSGKVEVNDATHTFGSLTHNKQLTYNTVNKTTQINESNWEDAAGWTKGRLVLNGGVEELRLRLRQQFGAEVSFEKNALANERLTGTFDQTSKLTDVLTTIGAIYNIRYTIINNHVTIRPSSSN